VGELIADQLSHLWLSSLLRGLADAIAPERQPALELTSAPVNPTLPGDLLTLPRWSALITGPRLPMGQKSKPLVLPPLPRPAAPKVVLADGAPAQPTLRVSECR